MLREYPPTSAPKPVAEPFDARKITPTQKLILETLGARHRLGEHLWPFDSRLGKQLETLAGHGLITVMDGNVERTLRASLTAAGLKAAVFPSYQSELERKLAAANITIRELRLALREG